MLVGGEKAIMCGVHAVHLVEFPEDVPNDDIESTGLSPGPFTGSRSMTSSFNIKTLRPRRRASAPGASSDDTVDELGDVARVLATEEWLE
jgi:hypothetical protein